MWTEEKLDDLLTTPQSGLVQDISRIEGDIMILGAGGKMGPSLAILARRAAQAAGIEKKIIAVSRFSDPLALALLQEHDVTTISADLTDPAALAALPDATNIIFMAGKKFGTSGNEGETWHMNAALPALVIQRFPQARYVVFSSGNIFPPVSTGSGGAADDARPAPVGEYAMSVLARERLFSHAAYAFGAKVLIYRLNYAVDLRYGVIYDIADKILRQEPISLTTPSFNCVWQGYANEVAIRSLLLAGSPAVNLNITGPETASVRQTALQLGHHLGIEPIFVDQEADVAYLNNAGLCFEHYGYPDVTLNTLIRWQAEWLQAGGRILGKPTHFEEREGDF